MLTNTVTNLDDRGKMSTSMVDGEVYYCYGVADGVRILQARPTTSLKSSHVRPRPSRPRTRIENRIDQSIKYVKQRSIRAYP